MTVSLVGIVTVQVYWINNAVQTKRDQFKNDVKLSLARAVERVNEDEFSEFQLKYTPILEAAKDINSTEIRNIILQQIDTTGKQILSYGQTIIEEVIKAPVDFLAKDSSSIYFKKVRGRVDITINSNNNAGADSDFLNNNNEIKYTNIKRFPEVEESWMRNVFREFKALTPINQRVNNRELNSILKDEFAKRNINIDFKYGVYSRDGFLTNLKSGYYTIDKTNSIGYPFFMDENDETAFTIFVTFPGQKEHILSDISDILLLSVFFIFIIVVAFSSSLYQLIRQKKISEIKSDFINNMTHEFKTPIATINLALDAIKNPKIINDNEKVIRYANMIREENKRMHGQVENVLRISRLEKNQLEINKVAIDMNDVIEEAISHVSLLIDDKGGSINCHFEALQSEIYGNQFHLTNVVVNMLENALKYSEETPKIDVYTESTAKYFIFKIKDEGIGMSKNAQKYVFNKFYREHKGNIHNVKGHGLGLAYVKEIVENHHGTVLVESEKGKGSLFTVKLPLV